MSVRRKQYTQRNVLAAAEARIRHLFATFDKVSVSFSGGKDSTACLNLAVEIARERGKLPVRAIFFDEEAIHPPTIEYVERIRQREDVALEWYCLPVQHRNACSNEQPFWTCWNPAEEKIWIRPMPEHARRTHPLFKPGMSFQELGPLMLGRNEVCIQGIRTQESMRRYRMVTGKKNESYIIKKGGVAFAYPIYDWSSEDVWRLVTERGYDYNRTYDIFNRTQLHGELLKQRVCPPYGEEPLRGLWIYAECWPEMWHRMLARVPGAATAWRYANTELYSNHSKPDQLSWEQYAKLLVGNYTEAQTRSEVQGRITGLIAEHTNKTDDPIPDEEAHPLSGCSWRYLAKVAIKGDFKDRSGRSMMNQAILTRQKKGMTLEEAIAKHGKKAK